VKLTKEQVMVAKGMKEHGTSVRQLAEQLEVTEGALRYRLKKLEEEGPEAADGRADQATALDGYEEAVRAIQERLEDGRLTGEGRPCQVRQIYDVPLSANVGETRSPRTIRVGRRQNANDVSSPRENDRERKRPSLRGG